MKRKRWQQWLAFLLAVVMLASTECTVLAQSQGTTTAASTEETADAQEQTEETKEEIVLPESVKDWDDGYEVVTTQEEADALRDQDGDKNLLIAADDCVLSGLAYTEIATTGTRKLDLSNVKADVLTVNEAEEVQLSGAEIEQLRVVTEEDQTVSVKLDNEAKIPDIVLEGTGTVKIEGNGSLGMVRLAGALAGLTVRATCSVLNESGSEVPLVTPDGDEMKLASGQQEELVLSSYMITFMVDGEVYETTTAKPGETIQFPEKNPEKEGYIFTCWYTDEDFTETCSQFATAEGETTLYGRFVDASEAVTVTFDTMGGAELAPMQFAKGETLLSRPVNEIYTEKEGYTFGGWCTDEECTTAFAYTDPIEESMTLYAFFVSNEVQEIEEDGTSAEIPDLDWQGSIALRTDSEMTLEEVQANVRLEPAAGAEDPVLDFTQTEEGFAISGSYYEKDGETGFEPGASFSIIVSGGVHFADYPDGTDTAVVTIQKERTEVVGFSEDITYVLWDDVLDYTPVTVAEDEDEATDEADAAEDTEAADEAEESEDAEATDDAEAAEETEDKEATEDTKDTKDTKDTEATEVAEDAENAESTDATTEEAADDTETSNSMATEDVADPEGENAEEIEGEAYTPGELLVKNTTEYKEGDIVAFYDGDIGRDEKNIDAYTEGSFDGYVLFAQIIKAEDTADGTRLTFGYASPEDYLADLDVNVTDDADLEQQLSEADLAVLSSRLSDQVAGNEELKAQMLVSVMSAPETQDMLDDLYGEGTYALAGMSASLKPNKPSVSLSVSGSEVTASISISATVTLKKDGEVMMTVEPTLSFTQSLGVQTNVKAGKVWINMAVTVRSTTRIALTVSATTGGDVSVFTDAKETLEEIVSGDGISEDNYDSYDESVSDLMDTMSSIVATSLEYNDIFDVLLLTLKFSFYGIVTVGFDVHLVGQVGVLATFGVEIVAKSGETIGFEYNFLKFKGKSYTNKLESSVTNNIYLIGKVGVRVGLRLELSVTICAIASATITGNLYAYAELTGLFFMSTNLLSGSSTNIGGLYFEVGIDVEVYLTLKVKLIIKTIKKTWTVYTGRWPLWSTSVSSKMSYMDEEKLEDLWEKSIRNADHKAAFGFQTIPMKTWELMSGSCQNNQLLVAKSSGLSLKVKNLVVNGEAVPEGDPRYGLFKAGDASKGQNPGYIYLDEDVAAEYLCEEAELDLELTYENNSSSALVKKQVMTFHLKKKCSMATTTHNVKVMLYDWCARSWGLQTAEWDNATVYETSFTSTHILGSVFDPTATGTIDLNTVVSAVQSQYPEIAQYTCTWRNPSATQSTVVQYSTPQVSSFCYMTPDNGVVRYDVRAKTDAYDVIYYLYVQRFEGNEAAVRYHINLQGQEEEDTYTFTVVPREDNDALTFTAEDAHTYLLEANRTQFDESEQPLMMSVNGEEATRTGFTITGREYAQDIYFDITISRPMLGIQYGEGVTGYRYTNSDIQTGEGIKVGTRVEIEVDFAEGYGGLEATSENENITFKVDGNKVSFIMPRQDTAIVLRAYRLHSITYEYQFAGYGTYQTVSFAENQSTQKPEDPSIEGLTFRGWYTTTDCTGEPYTFGDKLLTDVTLYADWTCDVTVHFTPAQGKAVYIAQTEEGEKEEPLFEGDTSEYYSFSYSTLRAGEKLLDIQIPEYEGYQFMGWYDNAAYEGDPIDLDTYVLSGGVEMHAKWAKMVDVRYDRNDGSKELYAETTGLVGYAPVTVPDAPERKYYTFSGWYRNPAATDAFDMEKDTVEGNLTLYAGWTANTYQITYDLAGGTVETENPSTYTTEEEFQLNYAPTREGYTFAGWTGTDLDEAAMEVSVGTGNGGDRAYTATWTPITYSIEYKNAYQNSEKNPATYNIESEEIVLEQPSRTKFNFDGWTGTDLEEATPEVHIPTGSIGDRIYTAVWSTEDPILKILDRVRVLAQENAYENDLSALMAETDVTADGVKIDETALEQKLTTAVEEHLRGLIDADTVQEGDAEGQTRVADYTKQIKLTVNCTSKDLTGDSKKREYTYEILPVYVDDDGNETPLDSTFTCTATLNKLTPAVTWPTASKLTYGKTLADSGLTGGAATYTQNGVTVSLSVDKCFAWENEAAVPFGRNNGTDDSKYTVIFTPTQNEYFATAENKVAVLTQVGVAAVATADDRDYYPGDTSATGTAYLVYVGTDGKPTTDKCNVNGLLKGGTWTFIDSNYKASDSAESDKKVRFTGYSLSTDTAINIDEKYGAGVYALADGGTTTCKATIKKVVAGNSNISITSPTAEAPQQYTYGVQLQTIKLKGGMVTYCGIQLEGTWSWQVPTSKPTVAGGNYTVVFTPSEKSYGNGFGTFTRIINVTGIQKKSLTVPTIENLTYNGDNQAAAVPDSTEYTVSENKEHKGVGEYTVVLALSDMANTKWDATKANVVEEKGIAIINYWILPAATTANTDNVSTAIQLLYGQKLVVTADGEDATTTTTNGKVVTGLVAAGKVSGATVTSSLGKSVTEGTWSWILTEGKVTLENGKAAAQPLAASETVYKVKALFTPTDSNLKSCEAYLPVKVGKATPDTSSATLTANIYHKSGASTYAQKLSSVLIGVTGKPKNPYTGDSIDGTWEWNDPDIEPQPGTKSPTANFTPTDQTSYTNSGWGTCSLTINEIEIVCDSITYEGDGLGLNGKLVVKTTPGDAIVWSKQYSAYVLEVTLQGGGTIPCDNYAVKEGKIGITSSDDTISLYVIQSCVKASSNSHFILLNELALNNTKKMSVTLTLAEVATSGVNAASLMESSSAGTSAAMAAPKADAATSGKKAAEEQTQEAEKSADNTVTPAAIDPTATPTEPAATDPTATPTEPAATDPTAAPTEPAATEPTATPSEPEAATPTEAPTPTETPAVTPTETPSESETTDPAEETTEATVAPTPAEALKPEEQETLPQATEEAAP